MIDTHARLPAMYIASCIKSAAACVVGAAVIVVAKPACDYTVGLVVKNTLANHLAVVEADLKNAIKLIKESLTQIEDAQKAINERIDTELSKDRESLATTSNGLVEAGLMNAIKMTSESLARIEDTQRTINERIDTELSRGQKSMVNERVVIEVSECKKIAEEARELALSTAPKISRIEAAVVKTASDIADANNAIGALPGVIDETAKKYSMYLHDEHSSLFEVLRTDI